MDKFAEESKQINKSPQHDIEINIITPFKDKPLSMYFSEAEKREREEGNDSQRFWNLLVDINKKINFIPPTEKQVQILDIACGRCEEAILLTGFFGNGSFRVNGEHANLVGIDIDQEKINKAKELNLSQNMKFICGDATKLNQYKKIPFQADIIVIQNQQISSSNEIWTKIFQQAIGKLTQEGILIITSLIDDEHSMLKKALQKLPCQIILDQYNSHSRSLETAGGSSIDRHVLVIKRVHDSP